MFPFHARLYGKFKCIHIMCSIVGIVLPLVSIITSMADFAVDLQKQSVNTTSQHRNLLFLSGGLGYRSNRYPPILCTGTDSDAQFYTFTIPIIIILASGCAILLVILGLFIKFTKERERRFLTTNIIINVTEQQMTFPLYNYCIMAHSIAVNHSSLGQLKRNSSLCFATMWYYLLYH